MTFHVHRIMRLVALACCGAVIAAGCTGSSAPSAVTLNLPDGTSVEVQPGAGAMSLANSAWECTRTAASGQSLAFVTLRFGPDGSLDSYEDSTIAPEIFGSTITFDGVRRETAQKGLTYEGSTYSAQTADGTGFSFHSRLVAYAGGIQVGYATADTTATLSADAPETMVGTFSYSTRVTLPIEIPGASTDEEFPFTARRLVE